MDKTYQILENYKDLLLSKHEGMVDTRLVEFIDEVLNTSKILYSKSLLSKLDEDKVKKAHENVIGDFSKEEQDLIKEVLYEGN